MLTEKRKKIDEIDDKIVALYAERMAVSAEIGREKANCGVAVTDTSREKAVISRVTKEVPSEIAVFTKQLFETLFETGKAYQRRFISSGEGLARELEEGVKRAKAFPSAAAVACQGTYGSFSSAAADKLFPLADVTYSKSFEGVFAAVEKGLCEFGVLPIENSATGSISAVYDLMREHRFHIVRSVRLPVEQSLLARSGTELTDVKEIVSHPQAFLQCKSLTSKLCGVKLTEMENTAVAAKFVAESGRTDLACLASRRCAELFGLHIIKRNVQDAVNNFTRFICISKDADIYDGANKISIMANLPHEAGSLNKLLNKFSALGVNLTKLESRPIADSSFEFLFYFDFDAEVKDGEVRALLSELSQSLAEFTLLGCYREVN